MKMEDIIDRVLKAEKDAENILGEARQKAQEMKRRAQEQAAKYVDEARVQATKILEDKVVRAQAEISEMKNEARHSAQLMNEEFLQVNRQRVAGILNKVVNLIKEPEQKKL